MGIPFTRKMVKFGCLSMKEAFLGSGSELLEYKWDDLEQFSQGFGTPRPREVIALFFGAICVKIHPTLAERI